jgi:hypothetical protein
MKRMFIVLEVGDGVAKEDVALKVDARLAGVESVVYDSLGDLVADRDEQAGVFEETK